MHPRRRAPSTASEGQRPLGRRAAAVSVLALAALTALLLGGSFTGTSAAPAPAGIGAAATDAPVEALAMKAPKTPKPPKNAPTTTTKAPATTTPKPTTTTAKPTTTTPRPTTTTPRPTTTAPTTAPATTAPTANATFDRVVALVNQERAKVGCMAVTRNAALDTAAQKHSVYQDETQTMRHDGRGGTDAGQRITAEGYRWSTWGENVAYGFPDADSVMNAWMNSQHHRENILNCKFKEIGMGLQGSKDYWTQDFATKQ